MLCTTVVHNHTHTRRRIRYTGAGEASLCQPLNFYTYNTIKYEHLLKTSVDLGLRLVFVHLLRFGILCVFLILLGFFVLVLSAFVALVLVSSVQETGWEERLEMTYFGSSGT